MRTSRTILSLRWRGGDCQALLILTALAGVLAAWTLRQPAAVIAPGQHLPAPRREKIELVRERIDPNTASAASLCRLPLVGPSKAGAIVEHRRGVKDGRAFDFVEDLQRVRGFGPGTIRRAAPFLSLPSRSAPTRPITLTIDHLPLTIERWQSQIGCRREGCHGGRCLPPCGLPIAHCQLPIERRQGQSVFFPSASSAVNPRFLFEGTA